MNEHEIDDIARAVVADFRKRSGTRVSWVAGPTHGTPLTAHARFSRCIDHTLLRPDATRTDIEQLCEQALEHDRNPVVILALVRELLHAIVVVDGGGCQRLELFFHLAEPRL